MSKIALLPQNLINQIAAGEVIERPSSVVKELVENSLDAGAKQVEVILQKAGREMICVSDNGSGMDEPDARMCLERHATSKIRSFDDLLQVGTMGFRGEALPSIASISYLTLKTRTPKAAHAFELRIEGGKKISEGPASGFSASSGTSITIEHLFYNVPARRKFLKSDTTELSHCVDLMKSLALANPSVSFKLLEGKRVLLDVAATKSSEDRVGQIFGKELVEQLKPIEARSGQMNLTGFLSPLGVSFPTRGKIAFFINRRPVDSKIFHQGLREAYGSSLARGSYPAVLLFLTLDASEIDVNVHPAKREVRFRAEREKLAFLIQALTQALQSQLGKNQNAMASMAPFSTATIDYSSKTQLPRLAPTLNNSDFSAPASPSFHVPATQQTDFAAAAERSTPRHNWQFLNFYRADFALFSTPEGLALVSVANAQERIAYEKIENNFAEGKNSRSQTLLIPALLQLEGSLEEILKKNEAFLHQQGFGVAPFGNGTWRLEAIPSWLSAENGFSGAPENFFIAELHSLAEGHWSNDQLKHRHFAQLAAKHARVTLSHSEAVRRLIDELLVTRNPLKAPNGEPTVWLISPEELNKRFGL